MKRIVLLRLGHRPERDKRITTHVGLTARLLGAEGMLLASDDPGIVQTLEDVVRRWGGNFYVKNNVNFKPVTAFKLISDAGKIDSVHRKMADFSASIFPFPASLMSLKAVTGL